MSQNGRVLRTVAAFGLCTWLAAPAARAAQPISNSLSGFTGDTTQSATQAALNAAGFNASTADADPAVVFDASGTHFGTAFPGNFGRNYIRTNDSDYGAVSFVAEITIETNSDDQNAFFGIGTGVPGSFGYPDWGTDASSAVFAPEPWNDKFDRFQTQDGNDLFTWTLIPDFNTGTHRFRMTFDSTTSQLLGEIDLDYAGGPFVADSVIDNVPIDTSSLFGATGWPGEPSRIFFGGDDGVVFRDLSIDIVPEPTTAAPVLLAGAAALVCRRRANTPQPVA